MATRSYEDAVTALNTLQTNAAVLDALRKSGDEMNKLSIPEALEWLRLIGYTTSDLNALNVVHVTGTKGKGSTCAFVSSMLSETPVTAPSGEERPRRVGLYTSPHLKAVRERIRINGEPLDEARFAKYFFDVWDRLEASGAPSKPVYFRFLTLVAWHTFISEKMDSTVVEVGVGGEYDCTNIIERPTATGVTSLGIDHTSVLGNTLESIAWHKGGIFKSSCPGYALPAPPSALAVLAQRAHERRTTLTVVKHMPALDTVPLGLEGEFQRDNASLAVRLVRQHLGTAGESPTLSPTELRGLQRARWPGRCQVVARGRVEWCLDGAHTEESVLAAVRWFATKVRADAYCMLVFNQQTRNAPRLLDLLCDTLGSAFDEAVFCTNVTWKGGEYKGDLKSINVDSADVANLRVQSELASHWTSRQGEHAKACHILPTIEDAYDAVREREQSTGREVIVFVTGSLHLVGGVLAVLDERA